MLPFKRILTTTDFSEPSYDGIKAANELAVHYNAELCLVHVISLTPVTVGGPVVDTNFDVTAYQEHLEASARKQLAEIMETNISPEVIKCNPIVVSGYAADEIVRIANEQSCDLIVIATHGLTGWRRFVFGSVAEKVVRVATCPVLTVRPKHD
jgi:nucleotide-binding universal stress UspA family protein